LSRSKKGLIEALSWKAIVAGVITVIGLWFGIPDYVYNVRPTLVANIGNGPVWFAEGAIIGASTVLSVLKLYSQFSADTEVLDMQKLGLPPKQIKKRIRDELQLLGHQIGIDLRNNNLQSRAYRKDAFQELKRDLAMLLDTAVFRQVCETYDKINELQYSTNLHDINTEKYREVVKSINSTIRLLK
jgi:hypothetical protein